jgi:hypothetical protein
MPHNYFIEEICQFIKIKNPQNWKNAGFPLMREYLLFNKRRNQQSRRIV